MHTFVIMIRATPTIKAADLQGIGISKPYSHQLVGGDRTPSLKLALRIEQALGVPVTAWPMNGGADHDAPKAVDEAAPMAPEAGLGALEKSGASQ